MPSVAKEEMKANLSSPVRTARCLRGLIDGEVVFRITNCRPERIRVQRRRDLSWIEAGWFSSNLLDD